jgi:hypothetical protein
MAMRILTGVLMTDESSGEAVVSFNPHAVQGDARGVGLAQVGPERDYRQAPARLVALREVSVDARGHARIDEKQASEAMVKISWSGVNEISYLVIGEVADSDA